MKTVSKTAPVGDTTPMGMSKVFETMKQFATLSQFLRILGAGAMVGSMSVFLLKGWSNGSDLNRYFLLLSQTGLLAAGGFALSYWLKENKGARLFFGLSLVSIPVNFTILGALVFSQVQWDSSLVDYPDYVTWVLSDVGSMVMLLAGAMAVLIPISYLGMSIMARASAKSLTANFLLLNVCLLLPVRSSLLVGVISVICVAYSGFALVRMNKRDNNLRTPEGRVAKALLFLPPIIVLGRSAFLYQADAVLILMMSLTVLAIMRQMSIQLDPDSRLRLGIDMLSPVFTAIAAFQVPTLLEPSVNQIILLPSFAIVFAVLVFETAIRSQIRDALTTLAGCVAALCFILNIVEHSSLVTAGLSVLGGAGILTSGYALRHKVTAAIGWLTLLISIGYGFFELIEIFDFGSWSSLAILGALAIVVGSVLDRHGASLKLRLSDRMRSLRMETDS